MKRVFGIAAVVVSVVVAVLLHTRVQDWLWTHPWTHSFLVAVPTIALAVIAFLEWRHSGEANTLRDKANELRRENIILIEALDTERNRHLGQIAAHTKPALTQAERNSNLLRKHIGANVKVTDEKDWNWSSTPEIVEVSEDNIVTLFTPRGFTSSSASAVRVHCNNLEITEFAEGSCPLRIKVLKKYGADVSLGEITKWEDRNKPMAAPVVPKGGMVRNATYGKAGSDEVRSLHVYAAKDGGNLFVLEAVPGGTFTGNNVEISKTFMLLQVEYEAAGFTHRGSGTGGGSQYPLYVKT